MKEKVSKFFSVLERAKSIETLYQEKKELRKLINRLGENCYYKEKVELEKEIKESGNL